MTNSKPIEPGATFGLSVFTDGSCVVGVRVDRVTDGRVHYSRLDGCTGGSNSLEWFRRATS